ncbi:acetyl-CoA C-acyltransferase [Paenibacillus sp. MBLB4367]|uniref:acetyl-CoA C-acyltransferase n=1 Tax=Paenibacillus sp. MBLB4367 TaxID=3384767 RepID=UPI0039081C1A
MKEAVIVTAIRTAVGRAGKGMLRCVRPDDLGGHVVREAIVRTRGVTDTDIDDVIIGCAMPEGEQGLNIGRIVALRAGLPDSVPGLTVNRFCASGLQAIAYAAQQIQSGAADTIAAGGAESMSMIPMAGSRPLPNPYLVEYRPELYMAMGHTAEEVAKRYSVSRADQDRFAENSHRKAAAAIASGKFRDETVPYSVEERSLGNDGKLRVRSVKFDTDEGVRADTSVEVLAKLRPSFHPQGTVTAGNASQMSDGAAAAIVMSREKANELGLRPLAIFRSFAVTGVAPDVMGVGPLTAIPKALKQAGIGIADVDLFEINEAFAAQCLPVIRQLGIDESCVNVNGGAIALGHPLGCTGAKLTATLLHEGRRRSSRYGVVSMCIGGGMGAAAVYEFA